MIFADALLYAFGAQEAWVFFEVPSALVDNFNYIPACLIL